MAQRQTRRKPGKHAGCMMNPIDLALACKEALSYGSVIMPLKMRGQWGKTDTRRLGKGGPVGKIVKETKGGIVVMFPVQEVLDYTIEQLASACHEIGCSGQSPETCPGDPDCGILRALFRSDNKLTKGEDQ
jgi:hypothetical protein